MIIFDNIYKEYYAILLFLAIFFYYISSINQQKILALIVIIILGYYLYNYLDNLSQKRENDISKNNISISQDIQDRIKITDEVSNENFYIKNYPKNIKYLLKNKDLMNIITNLRFVRKFDKTKYTDIIVIMDNFIKIYIYILSDRYDADAHIPIFMDLRYNILEILYSLYIVVPDKMNHAYGLDPYSEIKKSTEEFLIYSRDMINTLEKYGKIEKGLKYIQDNKYRASNTLTEHIMP